MTITIGGSAITRVLTRSVDQASDRVGRVSERLSSGLRINRASDDAAGLSVASTLTTKSRVLNRASQNLGDASSLLQIADGALSQISGVLTRMTELAQQAANGSYSFVQRRALDNEYQQLSLEIRRVVDSTGFNGITLLNGQQSAREAQRVAAVRPNTVGAMAASDNGRYMVYADDFNSIYRYDTYSRETVLISDLINNAPLGPGYTKVLNNGDVFFASIPGLTRADIFRWSSSDRQVTQLTNSLAVSDFSAFDVSADGSMLVFRHQSTTYTDGGTAASAIAGSGGTFALNLATVSSPPNLYQS